MTRSTVTTTFFAVMAAIASATDDSCPCFTAEQYAALRPAGCHFAVTPDAQTLGSAMAYMYNDDDHDSVAAVVQATVTVEDLGDALVEGGLCGIGGTLPSHGATVTRHEAVDYGRGAHAPEAFQDCVAIMQAACHATCAADNDGLRDLPDHRAGCGRLPSSSSSSNQKAK